MTWIRDTGEPVERRRTDLARLAITAVGVVLTGMWAQTQSNVNLNLFHVLNDLTDSFEGVAKVTYALGSVWIVVVVAVGLLVLRQVQTAWRVALVGAAAWGLAELLNDVLGTHSIKGLAVNVRLGDGPAFPAANVAIIVGLTAVLSPYVVRPLRRILALIVIGVATATMYLGVGFPADVLGGALLGVAVAALVTYLFGAPSGRLSSAEVRAALSDLGLSATNVEVAGFTIPRASVMNATLDDGRAVRVDAYGRDQRDAEIFARVWHRAMYREPGLDIAGTRLQQVEHVGYALMLAERSQVRAPRVVRTGIGGADAALLVTSPPSGTPIVDVDPSRLDAVALAAIWHEVSELHTAGISHGNLDGQRIRLSDDGAAALDDFANADVGGESYWIDRDDASVLVLTAILVGHEQAISATVTALGAERTGALLPLIQPAAMPSGITQGHKHLGKDLKALRAFVATATGAEEAPPLKVKRLSWANIGILAGVLFALVIAISSLEGVDWSSVQHEFETATWAWALLALILYPLVPMSWATALLGCVNRNLAFVPTALVQLACSFLNLITPNGIGGTALQLDYLLKQGVPIASGGSAMVLSTGVGGAIQMILFLIAVSVTATTFDFNSGSSSGSASLWVIAIVAALIGIVLLVPKIRGKVVPAVKQAASDIWAVVRNPRKAMLLLGGDTMGNLIYPALLGLCLLAFGAHLDFAQLMVVQIGAGMLGGAAPVPGGIGVQEAALTA
ncbi:MAG: lysylphosphatidylglycerol synthase domain-containing protein, partial [Acidimicrobiia bacterium]